MGAAHRGRVADRLMAAGLAPGTAVLAVQWGTEPQQASVRTTLADLAATDLAPPVTMVIGEVATLDLDWYGRRPLSARTVVVTRAAHQAPVVAGRLRDLGARVIELPVIALGPPADGGAALAQGVARLAAGGYSWAVFTSANAVEHLFALVPDTRALGATRVAAVGPATAGALRNYRVVADLVPTDYQSDGLLAAFPSPPPGAPPRSVLLPQAGGAGAQLATGLAARGWEVDAVEAYRTVPRLVRADLLSHAAGADAILFASPSAVASFVDQAEAAGTGVPPVVACIGPITAAAARARGLAVRAEAAEHTVDGLLAALTEALPARPG
jgi:uroporphyrinogen III methyltransferase/synthase